MGEFSQRRYWSSVLMDKWKLSRKRRTEKSSQAEHKVQSKKVSVETQSSIKRGPPATGRRETPGKSSCDPRWTQPALGTQLHPQVSLSRMTQRMTRSGCGLPGGFSQGQLLLVGSSLASNETDRLYRCKVRKYQSAQSRKREEHVEQKRSERYWFPFWSRSSCLLACPPLNERRILIPQLHPPRRSSGMFLQAPQTFLPFLLRQSWSIPFHRVLGHSFAVSESPALPCPAAPRSAFQISRTQLTSSQTCSHTQPLAWLQLHWAPR